MSAVRPLDPTPLGVAAVCATLGAAFVHDPMLQWIFPHPQHRAQATAAWLGIFVEAYSVAGVVDVVHDPLAAGAADGGNVGAAAAPAAVAGRLAGKAVFMAAGAQDPVVPVSEAQRAAALLQAAGAEVDYREYPTEHKMTSAALDDLRQWFQARR